MITLPAGPIYDISETVSPCCVIERKMSLEELAMCFGRGRDRFEREFQRARDAGAKIYIEGGTITVNKASGDHGGAINVGVLNTQIFFTGSPYVSGNTWTTDAFYRETAAKRDRLVKEGCVCVEMECASVQAVCAYYGIRFFPFFYGADSLHSTWARRILGDKEQSASLAAFYAAVKAAETLRSEYSPDS